MEEEELALKQELKKLRQQELEKRRRSKFVDNNRVQHKPNAIYLSNLSKEDTTEEQLIKEFSKFGMIKKDEQSNIKCKLYKDADGKAKGDGLIVYVRHESVLLAIEMMDGYSLNGSQIKVEVAQFENRKRSLQDEDENRNSKLAKRQDSGQERDGSRNCTVKILNVLNLNQELDEEDLNDIKQDVLDGCQKIGRVKGIDFNVTIGSVKVEFEDAQDARSCCNAMNGRYFDGRELLVRMLDQQDASRTNEHSEQEFSEEDDLLEV